MMFDLKHREESAKSWLGRRRMPKHSNQPVGRFANLSEALQRAPLKLRALYVLRHSSPEELCPASLMPTLFASSREIVEAVRLLGDLVFERRMPGADRASETHVYFRINPERILEIDEVLAPYRTTKSSD